MAQQNCFSHLRQANVSKSSKSLSQCDVKAHCNERAECCAQAWFPCASHIHIIFHKVLFKVNLLWCKKQKSTKTKEIFNRISNVSRCLKDICIICIAYTRITLVRTWLKIISFKFCVHSVWVCWKEVDFFNAIVNIKKCPETRTICGDKLFTLFAPWSSGWKVQKGSQRRLLN